jgi:sugar O-acyltransferase (sialic acid O-acetyltransferase NeuD family)
MTHLLIFGTGELADLAYYYFSRKGNKTIRAFVVDKAHLREDSFQGLPVLPFENIEITHAPQTHEMFIAIGSNQVNRLRAQKYHEARGKGYRLASFISPDAVVHTDRIGDNCFIMDNNNIHPYVSIGSNVIFSNDNHIGHHTAIADHCFITSNVVIGGGAHIGEGSFLGINATIRDHVTIGQYNVIGAGSLIMKDTQDHQVFSVEGTSPRNITSDRIKKL